MQIKDLIKMLRPHQYLKNLFVFLPLFFGLKITDPALLSKAFLAFISFSLIASAVYIFNDLNDIKEDRAHPKKKDRPIASGKISKLTASITMLILLGISILPLLYINTGVAYLLLLYVILNVSYTIKLRHVAIMDVSIIAIGFVIRIFVGSVATNIPLSMWIVLVTFLLALFLALAKRRDDVLFYLETGTKARRSIDGYNMEILDSLMVMMATVTIVSYIMYTNSTEVIAYFHTNKIYFTVFFVILGIMRYMQISFLENKGGSPTEILIRDRFIQLCLAGWMLTFAVLIYYNPHF